MFIPSNSSRDSIPDSIAPGSPSLNSSFETETRSSRESATDVALHALSNIGNSLARITSSVVERLISTTKPANFTSALRSTTASSVFSNTIYDQLEFNEALDKFRSDVISERCTSTIPADQQKIAHDFMTQPGLPQAHFILLPLLRGNETIQEKHASLQSLLENDRHTIMKIAHTSEQGMLHKNAGKFSGEFGLWFDSVKNGNLPFLLGTVGRTCILRHPVPTTEVPSAKENQILISEEYRAFLTYCKENNESVLYTCLLNPKNAVDKKRIQSLLALTAEYKGTFHVMRMPMDGRLSKVHNFESLVLYKHAIQNDIENSIEFPLLDSNEFLFGSRKLSQEVSEKYQEILNLAYDMVHIIYDPLISQATKPADSEEIPSNSFFTTTINSLSPKKKSLSEAEILSNESKKALMMLFCTMLRSQLISNLSIDYYNNSCKDAIDRGAAHLVSDLIWNSFLHQTLEENCLDIRLSAAWPAYMAKTQAIIEERAEWIDSFASFIHKMNENNLHPRIKSIYEHQFGGLPAKIEFYKPEIEMHQTRALILQKIHLYKDKTNVMQFDHDLTSTETATLQAIGQNEIDPSIFSNIIYTIKEQLSMMCYGLKLSGPENEYSVSLEINDSNYTFLIDNITFIARDSDLGKDCAEVKCKAKFSIPGKIDSEEYKTSISTESQIDWHLHMDFQLIGEENQGDV
ncbi:MAG: hypothetical protein FJZ57_06830 [Chlamydiae bacterium]|nr:hypothetical protein [Chlamydiota bacterium]